jgi:nicotinate-nucleotide adenylyltransferase
MATVCAAPRSDDGRERLLSYGKKIEGAGGTYWVGTIPFLPVSSTEVRQCLQAGKPIDHLVPKRVADYLYQHHLYTGGMHHDKRRI